jgi:hypothetical protein
MKYTSLVTTVHNDSIGVNLFVFGMDRQSLLRGAASSSLIIEDAEEPYFGSNCQRQGKIVPTPSDRPPVAQISEGNLNGPEYSLPSLDNRVTVYYTFRVTNHSNSFIVGMETVF